jgi:uncharacterized protein Yka (UPF0111/DUF47 family)
MSNPNDISLIRDLIIGETVQQFDERFKKVSKEISAVNKKLDQLVEQLSAEKSERQNESGKLDEALKKAGSLVDDMKNDLSDKLVSLESSKAARMDLGKIFSEVSKQLGNSDSN